MVKYKIERSAGNTYLVIQGQKEQQISEREYYAIHTGQIPGLLIADLVRKGNSFRLNYNISGCISLREYLFNPLTKQSFSSLLTGILNNLKALQSAYYNMQYILMDINAVMVNPSTHNVSFVYVPITFFESGTSLKEFLLSIINYCAFLPGEDTGYVKDYIRILNSGINFSVFDLEEYLKNLGSRGTPEKKVKKCTRCGSALQPNVNFCPACGMKIGSVSTTEQNLYDPLKNVTPPQGQSDTGTQQGILMGDVMMPIIDNMTPCNAPNDLQQIKTPPVPPTPPAPCATLYRIKTSEHIDIGSANFKIGKDPHSNDYCVGDNSAVSRNHAVIKYQNGRWYISDQRSTNKTYVNDVAVVPGVDVELSNGARVRLANENFVFNIM